MGNARRRRRRLPPRPRPSSPAARQGGCRLVACAATVNVRPPHVSRSPCLILKVLVAPARVPVRSSGGGSPRPVRGAPRRQRHLTSTTLHALGARGCVCVASSRARGPSGTGPEDAPPARRVTSGASFQLLLVSVSFHGPAGPLQRGTRGRASRPSGNLGCKFSIASRVRIFSWSRGALAARDPRTRLPPVG